MTAPGVYNAGAAYLEVIPSFRGVQDAIRREVGKMESALGKSGGEEFGKSFEPAARKAVDKALGATTKQAEKSGKEAAEAYAGRFADQFSKTMKQVEREAKALKLKVQPVGFDKLLKDMERLSKAKIGTDMDAGPALIEMARIETKLREIQDAAADVQFRTNIGAIATQFEAFRKRVEQDASFTIEPEIKADRQLGLFEKAVKQRLDAALSNFPPIEFDADVTPAQERLMELRRSLFELRGKRIGIDIGGSEASAEIERLRQELAMLARDSDVEINVRADAAGAAAELLAFRALVKLVDETKVEVEVKPDVDTLGARVRRLRNTILGAKGDGEDAANAFRSFNGVILGVALAAPAAAVGIAALAGGLALLAPLALGAAAGLGVLMFGFGGITDAVKALGKVQENAGKDAEEHAKKVRTAARGVADAQRTLSRARTDASRTARDAARAVTDAVERQEDAERDLERAQRDVLRAQEAVTEARERAADRIRDLRFQVMGGALAERQAVLDLKEAREEYKASLDDPEATARDREQLLINLEREELNLKRIRAENTDLAQERAVTDRQGVEGSDEVRSAREGVARAEEGVRAASERVADAQRAVQDAILSQREAQADAAMRIADAQRNLQEAQERHHEAVNETSTSVEALEIAMGKLGPAGQGFALFIHGLRDDFREMRDVVQAGIFPGLQSAISDILTVNGPMLTTFLASMSGAIGAMFQQLGDLMTSPQWQAIWATFTEYAPEFFTQTAEIAMNMLTFFGELFVGLAPYSERFGDALVRMSETMAEWMADFVQSDTFHAMMAWLFEKGPIIWETLLSVFKAIGNIIIALEPLGLVILGMIDALADFISWMDPAILGAIITAVLGLVIAFQTASLVVMFFGGLFSILTFSLAVWVLAIGAVITALVILWTQSETFRDIVTGAWDAVMAGVGFVVDWFVEHVLPVLQQVWEGIAAGARWLYDEVIAPIFETWQVIWGVLWGFMQEIWENVGAPLFAVVQDIIETVWGVAQPIFELIGMAFGALWAYTEWKWNTVGKPVFDFIMDVIQFLWKNIADPVFTFIAEGFGWLMDIFVSAWENVGKPIFEGIGSIVEGLIEIFQGSSDGIKKIWDGLMGIFLTPIRFVVETVINKGVIGGINKLASIFMDDQSWIPEVPTGWINTAQRFMSATGRAEGGPIPGFSPHKKADNVPIWATAGEFMQPVDSVNYYGPGVMEALRKRQIPREFFYSAQQRAEGGMIFPMMASAVKRRFPFARITSTYRPFDSGYHGRGQAIDIGGAVPYPGGDSIAQMVAINQWIAKTYGSGVRELIHTAPGAINLYNGRPHTYNPRTQAEHRNHVHWAMNTLVGAFRGVMGGRMAMGDPRLDRETIFGRVGDFFDNPVSFFSRVVDKFAGDDDGILDSKFGKMLVKLPHKFAGLAANALKDKLADVMGEVTESFLDPGTTSPNLAPAALQSKVRGVAALYGWSEGAQWAAINRLIQKESSWNPTAQNPTSTAYGLFQFLNGTWAGTGFSKTSDPVRQTQAGLTYIKNRYGTPTEALRFHNRNNWYSEGGQVGKDGSREDAPTLYDAGGWLPPGMSTVLNASGRPEPILTAAQWDELLASRESGGGPVIGSVTIPMVQSDPHELVGELNHQVQVARRGGRYGGKVGAR